MSTDYVKEALFALADIVRGGLPGQYIKRKGAQIIRKTTPSYYRAQEKAVQGIGTAYKHLDPATQRALQNSELVRSGMSPEGALVLAHMSARKGESTVDAVRRLTGGAKVPPPTPKRFPSGVPTMVQTPRTVPSAPAARTTAPAVPKAMAPTMPGPVPSRRVHSTVAKAPTMLAYPTKVGSAPWSMLEELVKLCAEDVTHTEARRSLEKLKRLKEQRGGELLRGAGVGAAVGPILGTVGRMVSGAERPKSLARSLASQAITGATYGGAIPYVKSQLERTVERERLKDYIAGGKRSGFRRTVARTIGV